MDKIINLVGASGTGKTEIAKLLYAKGYNVIMSYTNRKPRFNGEWGHIFVKYIPKKWEKIIEGNLEIEKMIIDKTDMIACQEKYGNYYWATKDQYKNKGTSIYVVCPHGANEVKQNVKDADVVTIFLVCDEEERIKRIIKRDRSTKNGNMKYFEAEERAEKDTDYFKICKCDYVIDTNRYFMEVINLIESIIKEV
ncbi:AAA family ATPase [Tissierella sp. MSJ-40]|uniref:AAA family ATPase n=1 Tax=Tissierella simiarum TaxID=2841534 RepID=A0ABS6ECX8_9FIRM|nr:AAA family ATPase [Tissierella simiarum]MBU5440391.1 AAA family ATPase [Tissierella simiarum]